jgi:hypothetical protein
VAELLQRWQRIGIHTFTSSGTFVPYEALTADYLVVAGGGGGGDGASGGGGAGGLRSTVTATGGGHLKLLYLYEELLTQRQSVLVVLVVQRNTVRGASGTRYLCCRCRIFALLHQWWW